MAEEASASEASVIESEGTLPVNALETQNSEEATIKSFAQGGTESTCNNDIGDDNNGAETSATTCSDGEREKSLEYADELLEKGSEALKDSDFSEATECFSRALEIRVAHYGELSPECINAYYKYGRALLYKAQEEADPLATVPKKEGESEQDSAKDGSDKNVINGDSTAASGSSNAENDVSLNRQEGEDEASGGKDKEEDEEDSDVEEHDADEDDSDLDLAWKMLDVARAIVEKHSGDTMEKVDILSALAEVALEREDIETSLGDYNKALSILERLVEPDSRHLAELYFRICLCLEIGSKPQEAILYCQKAISVCKARVQRLMNEVKRNPDKDKGPQQTSIVSQVDTYMTDKQVEIVTLTGLSVDLEKKLEDLEQLASNPKSILSEILGMAAAAKAKGGERGASSVQVGSANSNVGFDSPTASTAHTNGNGSSAVTHLGVVGRGVKRVLMSSGTAESNPNKKSASHLTDDKGDGKAS